MPVSEFGVSAQTRPVAEVSAWSRGGRLPFGAPAGSEARAMRDQLRRELAQLSASEGEVLHGLLVSDVRPGERVDLENVLLHNLESQSALAPSCRNGLRLERVFAAPAVPAHPRAEPRAEHLHRYQLASIDSDFVYWRQSRVLAKWNWVEVPDWSDPRTPVSQLWWRLRHAEEVRVAAEPVPRPPPAFAVRLELESAATSAAGLVKKTVDAVVAAFQFQPIAAGSPPEDILATQLGEPAEVIAGVLKSSERAVLGGKPGLVVKRGASLQWHPDDHLIVALELVLREPVGPHWRLRGEVLDVNPVSGRMLAGGK